MECPPDPQTGLHYPDSTRARPGPIARICAKSASAPGARAVPMRLPAFRLLTGAWQDVFEDVSRMLMHV